MNSNPIPSGHSGDHVGGEYLGVAVVDSREQEVGTVVDVAYDDQRRAAGSTTEQPTWLVVDPGMFRAAHWVPTAGTYRSSAGHIVLPWDRELVKHSPKADDDHVMTSELADELEQHYEISAR